MGFVDKMKARWGVGPWGVIAIMISFALAGMTVVYIKRPVLGFLLPGNAPRWEHWMLYALIIVPLYQITLLTYGTLLGMGGFFWRREKAVARAIGRGFRVLITGRS